MYYIEKTFNGFIIQSNNHSEIQPNDTYPTFDDVSIEVERLNRELYYDREDENFELSLLRDALKC